jgi:Dimethlysulfonioproprionate lyase
MARSAELAGLLSAVETALNRVTGPGAGVAADCVKRWQTEGVRNFGPARLHVCDHIAPALAACPSPLAKAFAAIEGQLHWQRRLTADPANTAFWNGHANAMILGPGGLEVHGDLWVGATIMSPGTLYDIHTHPPAEVYLPLSPGHWWNAEMAWTDPGIDGFIYNQPGIKHAMRAGATPFLALWVLPV